MSSYDSNKKKEIDRLESRALDFEVLHNDEDKKLDYFILGVCIALITFALNNNQIELLGYESTIFGIGIIFLFLSFLFGIYKRQIMKKLYKQLGQLSWAQRFDLANEIVAEDESGDPRVLGVRQRARDLANIHCWAEKGLKAFFLLGFFTLSYVLFFKNFIGLHIPDAFKLLAFFLPILFLTLVIVVKYNLLSKLRFGKLEYSGIHFLRYSIATHMYERGVNPRIIQVMLGHRYLSSTFRYIKPRFDFLNQMHLKYHPFQKGFL